MHVRRSELDVLGILHEYQSLACGQRHHRYPVPTLLLRNCGLGRWKAAAAGSPRPSRTLGLGSSHSFSKPVKGKAA